MLTAIQQAAALARHLRVVEAAAVLDEAGRLLSKGRRRAAAAWLALTLDVLEPGDLAAAVADALATVTGRYVPLFPEGPGAALAGKPLSPRQALRPAAPPESNQPRREHVLARIVAAPPPRSK